MERSEELFGIKFFSLHTVRYDFAIPLSNYLYPQDVSCATSTRGFAAMAGRRNKLRLCTGIGFGSGVTNNIQL